MVESRTHKSLRNIRIALFYYAINLILQFFSRKIFLDHLGAEILGLNTTAVNLLQFLNLAELGIGTAISYSLYKPLADRNRQQVNEIVSVQGYLYRRIGIIILFGAGILMCFFSRFFAKADLPLWYAYATFAVLLISSLTGYFFNYRQIVLTAEQKDYMLNSVVQSIKTIKVILQIFAIAYFSYGYIGWIALEFLASIITVFSIKHTLKKEYPWLTANPENGKTLRKKYPQIITKTKQLFFHKIATFALFQSSPLIVYAYTSLTLVAIYGNYMLIVTGITVLLNAIFNSIGAGIGNLVAEGDKKKILRVFNELFTSRFLFVATVCYSLYVLGSPFITLWIGKEYLLDNFSFILIICILYFNTIRNVVDSYINAYGLFRDIWAPITETALNIGLSVLLGYWWGLHGVLSGVLVSLLLIVFLWKPYFLFRYGIEESIKEYIHIYGKNLVLGIPTLFLWVYFSRHIPIDPTKSYLSLGLYSALCSGGFFVFLAMVLYSVDRGMKDFIQRLIRIIKP